MIEFNPDPEILASLAGAIFKAAPDKVILPLLYRAVVELEFDRQTVMAIFFQAQNARETAGIYDFLEGMGTSNLEAFLRQERVNFQVLFPGITQEQVPPTEEAMIAFLLENQALIFAPL